MVSLRDSKQERENEVSIIFLVPSYEVYFHVLFLFHVLFFMFYILILVYCLKNIANFESDIGKSFLGFLLS